MEDKLHAGPSLSFFANDVSPDDHAASSAKTLTSKSVDFVGITSPPEPGDLSLSDISYLSLSTPKPISESNRDKTFLDQTGASHHELLVSGNRIDSPGVVLNRFGSTEEEDKNHDPDAIKRKIRVALEKRDWPNVQALSNQLRMLQNSVHREARNKNSEAQESESRSYDLSVELSLSNFQSKSEKEVFDGVVDGISKALNIGIEDINSTVISRDPITIRIILVRKAETSAHKGERDLMLSNLMNQLEDEGSTLQQHEYISRVSKVEVQGKGTFSLTHRSLISSSREQTITPDEMHKEIISESLGTSDGNNPEGVKKKKTVKKKNVSIDQSGMASNESNHEKPKPAKKQNAEKLKSSNALEVAKKVKVNTERKTPGKEQQSEKSSTSSWEKRSKKKSKKKTTINVDDIDKFRRTASDGTDTRQDFLAKQSNVSKQLAAAGQETVDDAEEDPEPEMSEEELAKVKKRVWEWLRSCPDPAEFTSNLLPRQKPDSGKDASSKGARDLISKQDGASHDRVDKSNTHFKQALFLEERFSDAHFTDQPWIIQARAECVDSVKALYSNHFEIPLLDQRNVVHDSEYHPRSLYCFKLNNRFRRAAIALIEWKWFDFFILFIIAANTVVMAFDTPWNRQSDSTISQVLYMLPFLFVFIFGIEACLKIVAQGFIFGSRAYLKDPWNGLDFFIVITGLVDFLDSIHGGQSSSSSRALITFRLLRPLRIIRVVGRFHELRVLVMMIASCFQSLLNVMILVAILLISFGIVSFQLWQGTLNGKCFNIDNGTLLGNTPVYICSLFNGQTCPENFDCLLLGLSPNNGLTNFDNAGFSILGVFQILTADSWFQVMLDTQQGFSPWSSILFVLSILLGHFFLIKLILVVIANRYAEVKYQRLTADTALSLFEIKVGILSAKDIPRMDTFGDADPYVLVQHESSIKKTKVIKNTLNPVWNAYFILSVTSTSSVLHLTVFDWNRIGAHAFIGQVKIPVGNADEFDYGTDRYYELEEEDGAVSNGIVRIQILWRKNEKDSWSPLVAKRTESNENVVSENHQDKFFYLFYKIARSPVLSNIIILTVIGNMIVLAMDHNCNLNVQSCRDFKIGLEIANMTFALIFAIEMIIKLLGLGVVNYFKDTGPDDSLYFKFC
eukprot:755907-Hanusia_phi.AAC.1